MQYRTKPKYTLYKVTRVEFHLTGTLKGMTTNAEFTTTNPELYARQGVYELEKLGGTRVKVLQTLVEEIKPAGIV
jgi:hypothetical protein